MPTYFGISVNVSGTPCRKENENHIAFNLPSYWWSTAIFAVSQTNIYLEDLNNYVRGCKNYDKLGQMIWETVSWLKTLPWSKGAISFLNKRKFSSKKFSVNQNEHCGKIKEVALNSRPFYFQVFSILRHIYLPFI